MKRNAAILLMFLAAFPAMAQDEPAQAGGGGRGGAGGGAALAAPNPQPFDRVITKDAKSKKGLFTVYQVGERYYYEIPKSELGKQYLWNTQIAKTTVGVGYGGGQMTNRVVAWELRNNRVYLRDINFSVTANPDSPIAEAVKDANNDTIIMAFNVAAYHDGDPVIDVSRLFNTDVPEISARQHLGATAFDASRSFIDHISPYPENIEAEVDGDLYPHRQRDAGGRRTRRRRSGRRNDARQQRHHRAASQHGATAGKSHDAAPVRRARRLFHHAPRWITPPTSIARRTIRYIARWRLEKKDPSAAVSDPVKPIVYYIDSATPKKWVPWLKKGIEDWNEAFDAAGFKNAIIGQGRAHAAGRSRLEPRRRALLGDPLAAFDRRKRQRSAHFRSAHRRDSERRHSVLQQRDEPGPRLVFRAGGPARSARARSCRCPTI